MNEIKNANLRQGTFDYAFRFFEDIPSLIASLLLFFLPRDLILSTFNLGPVTCHVKTQD